MLTVEETIAALNRSALPTVIVEGDNDIVVLRRLEVDFAGLSVLPAGGRDAVLELFRRRSEITNSAAKAFVADRDCWVFAGVPVEFQSQVLILTDGYSLENDIISDGNLEALLMPGEIPIFKEELSIVIKCFVVGLARILDGRPGVISFHPNQMLDHVDQREAALSLSAGETFPEHLCLQVTAEYRRLLRGKTLLQTLVRQLARPGRAAKHHTHALMETVAVNRGALLNNLFANVGAQLA